MQSYENPREMEKIWRKEKSDAPEYSLFGYFLFSISRLKICIFKLEICIFRLDLCISRLEIEILFLCIGFWIGFGGLLFLRVFYMNLDVSVVWSAYRTIGTEGGRFFFSFYESAMFGCEQEALDYTWC